MRNIKTLSFLKKSILSLFILIPVSSFAMEKEEVFKIGFASRPVTVRTSNNKYVESTWEKAIPNQGLAENSVINGCKIDPAGMCCSHAVVSALEYCHNRSDLLASYLHKAVTGGYDKGMVLEDAMNFVKDYGVMALPPDKIVKHGSGLPWPDGERYKFSKVIDADSICSKIRYNTYLDKAFRYKKLLEEYNHPIVVSILSGYEGYRNESPFLKYRGTDGADPKVDKEVEIQDANIPSNTKKRYHAVLLYGFRESTKRFFVKNSWGPGGQDGEDGLCTLPYNYINKFADCAFVGLVQKDSPAKGKRERQDNRNLVEQHDKSSKFSGNISRPFTSISLANFSKDERRSLLYNVNEPTYRGYKKSPEIRL